MKLFHSHNYELTSIVRLVTKYLSLKSETYTAVHRGYILLLYTLHR